MMRGRRMGRPGLVGTMARTAVIAGTASTVAGGVQRRQAVATRPPPSRPPPSSRPTRPPCRPSWPRPRSRPPPRRAGRGPDRRAHQAGRAEVGRRALRRRVRRGQGQAPRLSTGPASLLEPVEPEDVVARWAAPRASREPGLGGVALRASRAASPCRWPPSGPVDRPVGQAAHQREPVHHLLDVVGLAGEGLGHRLVHHDHRAVVAGQPAHGGEDRHRLGQVVDALQGQDQVVGLVEVDGAGVDAARP